MPHGPNPLQFHPMTVEQVIGFVLALLLMGAGLVGCVVPGLPGTPLVLGAAVLHRIYFGASSVGNAALALLVGLALLALLLDYLASVLGARALGATWRGMVGAIAGLACGLLAGPVGVVIGPFLGATGLEMLSGRDIKQASRAGLGAFLGLLVGGMGKIACCVAMIGLFTFSVVAGAMP